ncbi:hypothetical protein [Candidatus Nanohalobium constans]|uniref:Uncharacterized protein n=1 Tax=Candidatus Nanohalobium constans TaxID=2565781 RepID=A0A5Q0UG11_9ARCH|nr:hypothetical protein [Candidatus Nanohalobium constans]QGA80537.1 hypothetical protein LC1Nh_0646 [Candidatus Nanohalobium constans]
MDFHNSVAVYKVFRNIFLDDESNSVRLGVEHGFDDEQAEQIILGAVDEGYLDVVKDSDPREYTVDFDKLAEQWSVLWDEELDEAPVTPQNFESFLKSYIKSYFRHEKHTSLREMLVEEFYLGLTRSENHGKLSKDFRELEEELGDFDGKRSPSEHVEHGLRHR